MSILDRFTSGDSHEIWAASCEIAKCSSLDILDSIANELEDIESATSGIELGGGFCPNSYHLEFALKKLAFVRKNSGCLCALYPEYMFFNPINEEKSCNATVTEVKRIEGKWNDYYRCECNKCHTLYKVEEREGHFTTWSWTKA